MIRYYEIDGLIPNGWVLSSYRHKLSVSKHLSRDYHELVASTQIIIAIQRGVTGGFQDRFHQRQVIGNHFGTDQDSKGQHEKIQIISPGYHPNHEDHRCTTRTSSLFFVFHGPGMINPLVSPLNQLVVAQPPVSVGASGPALFIASVLGKIEPTDQPTNRPTDKPASPPSNSQLRCFGNCLGQGFLCHCDAVVGGATRFAPPMNLLTLCGLVTVHVYAYW